MTAILHQIWRYPIKAIGAELLDTIALTDGHPLPLDRAWAVLEDGGDATDGWRSCRNFLRGAKGPALMGVWAKVDGETLTLSHNQRPDLQLSVLNPSERDLIAWLTPIYPETRAAPVALVTSPSEGMADVPFASVSIMTVASLGDVSRKAGQTLDPRRFRGNLWLENTNAWSEFDLIGKTIAIGNARLCVKEPITRCRATEANTETGERDVNMLKVLEDGFGHSEFGVNAAVTQSGTITIGDEVHVL